MIQTSTYLYSSMYLQRRV